MKLICWLFLGTLTFGQAKYVNCPDPYALVFEDKTAGSRVYFTVKYGKRVNVLEYDTFRTKVEYSNKVGFIGTDLLSDDKPPKQAKVKKQRPPINWQPAIDSLKATSKSMEYYNKQVEKQRQNVQLPPCPYHGIPGNVVYDKDYGWCVTW